MPKWVIHRKWCRKLGISEEVADGTNELIDFPENWISKNIEADDLDLNVHIRYLQEIGVITGFSPLHHDWGRRRKWELDFLLDLAYGAYGEDGVKCVFLHHALDYIGTVGKIFPKSEILKRIKNRLWSPYYSNMLLDVLDFLDKHFNEILADIESGLGNAKPQKRQNPKKITSSKVRRKSPRVFPTYKLGNIIITSKFLQENWEEILQKGIRFVYMDYTSSVWFSEQDERSFVKWWMDNMAPRLVKIKNDIAFLLAQDKTVWELVFSLGLDSEVLEEYLRTIYTRLATSRSLPPVEDWIREVKFYIRNFWRFI
ncbi:hypothetical protein P8X24_05310 [Pyrococcus kukulkanii]|uniref:hypothetical protein n=1 Tax=Pyrococcus kukulkanii TaxID=1609559 RepID=UPI0035686926